VTLIKTILESLSAKKGLKPIPGRKVIKEDKKSLDNH
jgi:hypothetical protein